MFHLPCPSHIGCPSLKDYRDKCIWEVFSLWKVCKVYYHVKDFKQSCWKDTHLTLCGDGAEHILDHWWILAHLCCRIWGWGPEKLDAFSKVTEVNLGWLNWGLPIPNLWFWDFPGGPVADTSCSQCRGLGLIPGQGPRFHMPQLRVHMPQLAILQVTKKIKDPKCCS